jgi:integrase/recombinase XerD
VSEAIGANIEALGLERGDRTLTVLRKGGKVVTMPLAARVATAVDLNFGQRIEGPIFPDLNGLRLDRQGGSDRTRCVTPSPPPPSTLVCRCATCRKRQPRRSSKTMRNDRGRQSSDRHATSIVATFIAGATR